MKTKKSGLKVNKTQFPNPITKRTINQFERQLRKRAKETGASKLTAKDILHACMGQMPVVDFIKLPASIKLFFYLVWDGDCFDLKQQRKAA